MLPQKLISPLYSTSITYTVQLTAMPSVSITGHYLQGSPMRTDIATCDWDCLVQRENA